VGTQNFITHASWPAAACCLRAVRSRVERGGGI